MTDISKRVVFIMSATIASCKALEVIRLLRKAGVVVIPVLTSSAREFVTPTSVSVLSEHKVVEDFSDLDEGYGMGHIELSRSSDLVVVCPASADIMAQSCCGLSGSVATALLLASNKPLMMFPAMNPSMWDHLATKNNIELLRKRGVDVVEPDCGETACGEFGKGRLLPVEEIFGKIMKKLNICNGEKGLELKGRHVLITAGPTYESLDAVRVLSNRSSGRQGYALAREAKERGGRVSLVSGPVAQKEIDGVDTYRVESANQMLEASQSLLPADIMIACAAVCDWYIPEGQKRDKIEKNQAWQELEMIPTPDIVATIDKKRQNRPRLIIGFAAETGQKTEI